MANKCKVCGAGADSEYCFRHKPRKPLPKSKGFSSVILKKKPIDDMKEFFLSIWKTKPHRSEISGVSLGKEPSTAFFHHILPKSKYPEARLDEENIILLTLEEHDNVENDMYRYEEVNQRREYLLQKYERGQ